jgi:protein-S-isoprenylcysteine O-methyltransferase Ste14
LHIVTAVLAGKIGWALMVTSWYVIRYPYERRSKRASVQTSEKDRPEYLRMAIAGSGLGIVPALYLWTHLLDFADRGASWITIAAGFISGAGALAMFVLTHRALGKLWSVSLQLKQAHRLVTEGVYEKLRHPMYSAFWLMALAQAFFLANWAAGLSGLIGFGFLFFSRIEPEEAMMEAAFGDEYRAYKGRSWRIIPRVW